MQIAALSVVVVIVAAGCQNIGLGGYDSGPAAPGGDGTVNNYGPGAFSQPAANLDASEGARFRIGDAFFTQPWSAAPGSDADRDGLGPTYLSTSCAACHPADGVASAPGPGAGAGVPILRFSDGALHEARPDAYNVQVQTRAVAGVDAEAQIDLAWKEVDGRYPDGMPFSLREPVISVRGWSIEGVPAPSTATGVRMGPRLIGLGLLEAIPSGAIRAGADPEDLDGDGVSGVASMVDSPTLGPNVLGRFGLKANVATVEDQTAIAYLLDLGITSPIHARENCPAPQASCVASPTGGEPEISAERFGDVVFYARTLAVPGRPSAADASVLEGRSIFDDLGCSACHTPSWTTGPDDIGALADQSIHPYTDLLLHDMGEGLSDGRSDGMASPNEWRTSPLWGVGLVRTVNDEAGFLHDGRARSIEEAILWHGGEAGRSRDAFVGLSAANRDLVLVFLKSL